jgi:ABC-2 type transport system ATP-binding protein
MLQVDHLTKRYGERTALADLSLSIEAGQFVVLLGPNGAGKSTLFQVLTGLFAADEGDVTLEGHSLRHEPTRVLAKIGVVFQQQALDLDLSVQRNLKFHADLHGLPGRVATERIGQVLERIGLAGEAGRVVRELSGGNRRKVELARALLHEPRLLLMDEATVGLDPKSRRDLRAAIDTEIARRKVSVLWATHWVEEAEGAHRVVVLHKGRLLADGRAENVADQLGGGSLEAAFVRATTAA